MKLVEIIGPSECPIIKRYTLLPFMERKHENTEVRFKLMVHHFLPNADDRDVHDHPRPFWTFVLRGWYDDMKACIDCNGRGGERCLSPNCEFHLYFSNDNWIPCKVCNGTGVVLNERMKAGMLRFRPARHKHRTKVGPKGCWTIVLMGPIHRRWGFWRFGEWVYWKDYEKVFGHGMRCED